MSTYVVIREGLFLVEFPGGAIGWTPKRGDATEYTDRATALQKGINFRGFVLMNVDKAGDSVDGYCTVRLTIEVHACSPSTITVHGVDRKDLYALQREMVGHIIKIEKLLSACIQIDPKES